jgi:hypothetical protein
MFTSNSNDTLFNLIILHIHHTKAQNFFLIVLQFCNKNCIKRLKFYVPTKNLISNLIISDTIMFEKVP